MPKGRILIVSDDDHTRQQVEHTLAGRGYETISASSGVDGLEKSALLMPHLIVLDADMQGGDGIHICQEFRKATFVPIVLLSSHSDETDIVLGLGLGADYYLVTPFRPSDLLARAEAAIRRETIYSTRRSQPEILEIKDLRLDFAAHELSRDGAVIPLSPTEFRLVRTLALNGGRILTRNQLLDGVWDIKADGVYSRTVDVHVGRVRRKLGQDPTKRDYIVTVPGLGYKLPLQ